MIGCGLILKKFLFQIFFHLFWWEKGDEGRRGEKGGGGECSIVGGVWSQVGVGMIQLKPGYLFL